MPGVTTDVMKSDYHKWTEAPIERTTAAAGRFLLGAVQTVAPNMDVLLSKFRGLDSGNNREEQEGGKDDQVHDTL